MFIMEFIIQKQCISVQAYIYVLGAIHEEA